MNDPEQAKKLATICSLSQGMEKQALSDIQLDLLEVVVHLMTNIAVQSTLHGRLSLEPHEEPAPEVFELGEPVLIQVPADRLQPEHWQRTTIINKAEAPGLEGGIEYQTAFTGRELWVGTRRLKKTGTGN